MSIVQLRKPAPCEDIVRTLRAVANDIEAGDYASWPLTTAVLVFGHTESRQEGDETALRSHWSTHGFGPRSDVFTVRGLLASVIHNGFDGSDE